MISLICGMSKMVQMNLKTYTKDIVTNVGKNLIITTVEREEEYQHIHTQFSSIQSLSRVRLFEAP